MTCSLLPGLALRDATLRAAPQVSDLVDLRWEQVDFEPMCPAGPQGQEGHRPATATA